MPDNIWDDTKAEAEIRRTISHTCKDLGLTVEAGNIIADRVIRNLRKDTSYSAQPEIDKLQRREPLPTEEELVTRLVERWQDR